MKQALLGNLGTLVMALVLAILTWVYLFAQDRGTEVIEVEFNPPALSPDSFASVTYVDAKGNRLDARSLLQVRLTGPRGAVNEHARRPPGVFKCEPAVKPEELNKQAGTRDLTLERTHFSVPGGADIDVEPIAGRLITLQYVTWHTKQVRVTATKDSYDGTPAEGYRVESVVPLTPLVRVKAPADKASQVESVRIKRVPVHGRFADFPSRGELDPSQYTFPVIPVDEFQVEVKIARVPGTRTIERPLVPLAPPTAKKFSLAPDKIKLLLEGPPELVEKAPESAFQPFVRVTAGDLDSPLKNLDDFGCHVDRPYQGRITVIFMPDVEPKNRQVVLTVQP